PQGLFAHEALELGNELAIPAESELGLDPLLDRSDPKLLEPGDLGLGEELVAEVGERRAAPEIERASDRVRSPVRLAVGQRLAPLGDQRLEPVDVECAGLDVEDVAVPARLEASIADQL